MKKSLRILILSIAAFSLFFSISYSFGETVPPEQELSFIPGPWTEIDPAQVYPEFTYNGLTPSCAACPPTIDAETGETITYDDKFTFFTRKGHSNNLVIYFQGGGACWDSVNCLYEHTYYEEVPPSILFAFPRGMGIFDGTKPSNPFRSWNFVYIPYCTGDIHWGARDAVYTDTWNLYGGVSQTIRHRGFVNFQVALKWAVDNFPSPRKIFVAGSSAGSYGAILGFPYVKEAFPQSEVYVLGDAGNGVVAPDFTTTGMTHWNVQFPSWIPGFDNQSHPEELNQAEMYSLIAAYYPESKIAQYTTAWDSNQAWFYNVQLNTEDPLLWDLTDPVWCDWHTQMLDFVHYTAALAPNYRYYIAAGDIHTILMSPDFYTENSTGIPFLSWVQAMVSNPFGTEGPTLQGRWMNLECKDCEDPVQDCSNP